jgi:hypothetical protein
MGDLLQSWNILILLAVVGFIVVSFRILPFWFICKKAGFSPWLSLLYLVPLGGVVLNFVLAFGNWRVLPAPPVAWTPQQFPPQPPYLPQG